VSLTGETERARNRAHAPVHAATSSHTSPVSPKRLSASGKEYPVVAVLVTSVGRAGLVSDSHAPMPTIASASGSQRRFRTSATVARTLFPTGNTGTRVALNRRPCSGSERTEDRRDPPGGHQCRRAPRRNGRGRGAVEEDLPERQLVPTELLRGVARVPTDDQRVGAEQLTRVRRPARAGRGRAARGQRRRWRGATR
jgi:hypothetical protein